MAQIGLRWCRGCTDWLQAAEVTRQGACRPCTNAEYRARYAQGGGQIRARVSARKRGVEPVPDLAREVLGERFGGCCAYCPAAATTWDHIVPVSAGGRTEPGNVVPACVSCNSSKRAEDLAQWLARTGRLISDDVLDVLMLAEVA